MIRPVLIAAVLSFEALSQDLVVSELVLGQPAALSVSGTAPFSTVAWLISFGGPGAGPCVSLATCLDLLPPYVLLAVVSTDAVGSNSVSGFVPATAPMVSIGFQCLVQSGAAPIGKTPAVWTSIQPLSHYDDEFDSNLLSAQWTIHQPNLATIQIGNGRLDISPTTGGLPNMWYQGGEGVLIHRLVSGDFTVTTRLTVDDPATPGSPPPAQYRFAGIMARNPDSTTVDQDFVHAALGVGGPSEPMVSEDKSNSNSVSDWVVYPVGSNTGELRITRVASLFSLYYRADPVSAWTLMRAHDRPDLPLTLQIGLMAYSASSPAAVRGRFDYVRFE